MSSNYLIMKLGGTGKGQLRIFEENGEHSYMITAQRAWGMFRVKVEKLDANGHKIETAGDLELT